MRQFGRGGSMEICSTTTEPGVCCRCCRYRRVKRGQLASKVLVPRKALRVWFDFGAQAYVVWDLMFVPDTALALTSAFASVLFFHEYLDDLAVNLSWTAVTMLIAFPLQNAIREAYRRREVALQALVEFRATMLNVYLANSVWDWPGAETYNGRFEDDRPKDQGGVGLKKKPCNIPLSADHADRVEKVLLRICDATQEFLLIPRAGHARNELVCGRTELVEIEHAVAIGRETILRLLARLHRATEDLKAAGMPANEASRINQYNMFLVKDFEKLYAAKTYNTPIGMRAVLRVVIQILPFFYGPYWLHVAKGDNGKKSLYSIVFAMCFSSLISLLLIAMSNLEEHIENPFKHGNRETIRVKEEMADAKLAIRCAAEDMRETWYQKVIFDWEVVRAPNSANWDSDESSDETSCADCGT